MHHRDRPVRSVTALPGRSEGTDPVWSVRMLAAVEVGESPADPFDRHGQLSLAGLSNTVQAHLAQAPRIPRRWPGPTRTTQQGPPLEDAANGGRPVVAEQLSHRVPALVAQMGRVGRRLLLGAEDPYSDAVAVVAGNQAPPVTPLEDVHQARRKNSPIHRHQVAGLLNPQTSQV